MVQRYDRATFKATRTPEGFVQDSPILSRVGVFEYRQPDGTIRKEYRPAEEVFHADHLASVQGKPITDEHHGLISGSNVRGKLIGSVTSPGRQDGDNLVGDVIIYDGMAVLEKRELSLGYSLDTDETPGEHNGIRYDAVQRNLRVNHLALVKKGRAGNARLNLDAADAVSVSAEDDKDLPEMTKIRLDSGLEYEAAPEVAVAFATMTVAVKTQKDRADAAEATRDGLQAKVDAHKAELVKVREDARKEIAGRIVLEAAAKEVGATFKQDADDATIRTAVIHKVCGSSVNLDGKSDAYLEARYDAAVEQFRESKRTAGTNRAAFVPAPRQDGDDTGKSPSQVARDKMIAGYNKTAAKV